MTERSKEQVTASIQLIYDLGKAEGALEATTNIREMVQSLAKALDDIHQSLTTARDNIKAELNNNHAPKEEASSETTGS